jgi:hypothetical protein
MGTAQEPVDLADQISGRDWLEEERHPQRLRLRIAHMYGAADNDHGKADPSRPQFLGDLSPGPARHVAVKKDEVEGAGAVKEIERLLAVSRLHYLEARVKESLTEYGAQALVIIGHEDPRHAG